MKQEIEQALDLLAARFGTTIEHLWDVLLRQAMLDGITNLAWALALGVAMGICIVIAKKGLKAHSENSMNGGDIVCGIASFVAFFCGVLCVMTLFDGFRYLANPEYYALKEILKAIRH